MAFKISANISFLKLEGMEHISTPLFEITSSDTIKSKILDQFFLNIAGFRIFKDFEKNLLAYYIAENKNDDENFVFQMSNGFFTKAYQLSSFVQFLWYIKDNSISIGQAYGIFTKANKYQFWTDNNKFSTSSGEFVETTINSKEMKQATDLMLSYVENCTSENRENETTIGLETQKSGFKANVAPYKQFNRIERSMAFLSSARSSAHLPQKITHYMSILECLFSGDASEVVHKVSERVAYYIGSNKDERIQIFKTIKTAYGIRSKFVHGSKIKDSHTKLRELSIKIDNYVREIMTKVVTADFEIFLNDKRLEAFQNEIVF